MKGHHFRLFRGTKSRKAKVHMFRLRVEAIVFLLRNEAHGQRCPRQRSFDFQKKTRNTWRSEGINSKGTLSKVLLFSYTKIQVLINYGQKLVHGAKSNPAVSLFPEASVVPLPNRVVPDLVKNL